MLDGLPPERAAILSEWLEPACWSRARRYRARDEAVLACFDALADAAVTRAARRIEIALGRYLAGAARTGQNFTPAGSFEAAIAALAVANGGRPIGVRQLLNISSGRRR